MTDFAIKMMNDRLAELEKSAAESRASAAEHREDAERMEASAVLADSKAADLRKAIAKLQPDAPQWTKDDLARFAAEGHQALEPNELTQPTRAVDDWTPAALPPFAPISAFRVDDPRYYQPDGDTYGRDFVEPHLG